MIAGVADTHTALWHLFDDKRLSAAAEAFINEAATGRRKIAISTISLAEVVYLIEKNRLPQSAYDDLTQALADPEHVFTEAVFSAAIVQSMRQVSRAEVPKYRTCQTVWWRQQPSISMCRLSGVTGASALPA
jgi:PIN domain nuclease of toxin-antitoxin system